MLLSIVIPTYKRPECLKYTLDILYPQLTPDVSLVILNNDNEVDLNDFLRENYFEGVEVINNRYNVGGNANILRCVEVSRAKYLWALGDDDIPTADCIKKILDYSKLDYDYICFSHMTLNVNYDRKFSSIKEMYELQKNIQNYMFISTNIYKVSRLTPYLDVGYHFIFTCTPILNCLICSLDNAPLNCVYSAQTIIKSVQDNDRGNPLYALLGISNLNILPVTKESSEYISLWVKRVPVSWINFQKYIGFQYLFYRKSNNTKLLENQIYAASKGIFRGKYALQVVILLVSYIFKWHRVMNLIIKKLPAKIQKKFSQS